MIQIKLKTLLLTTFLLLGLALALGYSALTTDYLFRGMDTVLMRDMERTIQSLSGRPATGKTSGRLNDYVWAKEWQQLPEAIQTAFVEPPEQPNVLYKQHNGRWNRKPDVVHFVMRHPMNELTPGQSEPEYWYISTSLDRPSSDSLFDQRMDESRRNVWIIGAATLLLVGLIAVILYRLIAGPTSRLLEWTRQLDVDTMKEERPDFGYPELNELASLFQVSMTRVQQTMAREQAFLRFASHELRTPIAVIRNNTELLTRMSERGMDIQDDRVEATLQRLERAGITMAQLTETLLWLSREDMSQLPEQPLRPCVLIQQLTDELGFLLNNKNVTLELTLDHDWCAELPETPLRIVLGNLIRNAFQHTWEGTVTISQRQGQIHIDNTNHLTATEDNDLGFGLGLQLTQQLTDRLGWHYQNHSEGHGHRVLLALSDVGVE